METGKTDQYDRSGRHPPAGRHFRESEMHHMGHPEKEERTSRSNDPEEPTLVEKYVQPCLAELTGTIFFIAAGCLSVITNPDGAGTVQPALAHGVALGTLISVFGKISGGHFNPAVTLAACIAGGLTPILLVPYWICQLVGGMLGALIAKSMVKAGASANGTGPVCMVGGDASIMTAVNTEMTFSFLLILVVLMGAVDDHSKTPLAPFSIGFVVMAGILSGGTISGSCLNPARAFGPAVVWNSWKDHWIYWVAPMACAILVGLVYRFLLGGRSHRLFLK